MLGRLHRNGQTADEIVTYTVLSNDFDDQSFASTLNDACYIHTTAGTRQKLMYASYNPLPVVFPSQVLKERGFENRILTKEEQRRLDETFQTAKVKVATA